MRQRRAMHDFFRACKVFPYSEMEQGSSTGLPMILAGVKSQSWPLHVNDLTN
ncbi:MAG: hypothetical protein IIB73_11445 [Proteobacteria bacterium]|nr:hypothetical protein [Pseudomonadota bacterium]